MPYLTVTRKKPHTFDVDIDGHVLVVEDRPAGRGHGMGPTPVELTVAALASGVAAAVDAYLSQRSLRASDVRVSAHYRLSSAA
ncbi:MAG TPA: OsmC family protein, partial [Candidatus Sulfotelmatobacter sp.]|nr:OsmC family protein [Candidatus Sulfotelmatobacter sp.]